MTPFSTAYTFSLRRAYLDIFSQARYVWLILALISVFISMPSLAAGRHVLPLPIPTMPPKTVAQAVVATPVTPPPISSPAPAVTPAVSIAAPQDCTAPTYSLPLPIDLSDKANGLTQVTDTPTYYRVYGNTAAQIKAQLLRCTPLSSSIASENGSFAARTGSALSWQYSSTPDGTGTCRISNVKVGLHLNMILPLWQPTGSAVDGLAGSWQNLISNLTIHENGHLALYQQYASQLVNDLQSLPAVSCESTAASVASKSAADVAALNTANADYDTSTNNGVEQGVVLR